jgi:hypothetical protein
MGAIGGSDSRTQDDSGKADDLWFTAAHAAIKKMKPAVKGQRRFFMDLEKQTENDYGDSVYAFFVFAEQ